MQATEVEGESKLEPETILTNNQEQNQNPSQNNLEVSSNMTTSDKNTSQNNETTNITDDPELSNFFAEIIQDTPDQESTKKEKILTSKYQEQDLGTSEEQISRLLQPYYEWRNLNPYDVLMLDVDATEEDIRQRYRKLSSLVHPDKSRNERAREAFEEVKKAYQQLNDEDRKRMILLTIESIREQFEKEKKKKAAVHNAQLNQNPNEERTFIQKKFAEIEMRRRNTEKHQRAHQKREREEEEKIKEEQLSSQKFEKEWSDDKRRTDRVGNWRDFQTDGKNKKMKMQNWNQEERKADKQKYGQVELESWKKNWK